MGPCVIKMLTVVGLLVNIIGGTCRSFKKQKNLHVDNEYGMTYPYEL